MKKLSQFKEGLNSYKDISFYLKRKSKKNLNIRINAKNEIEVSIPPKAKDDLLIEFLEYPYIKGGFRLPYSLLCCYRVILQINHLILFPLLQY